MIPASPSPSPQREALGVGIGALGALQIALCDVEWIGAPSAVAILNLDHDPDDLTTIVVRMNNAAAAYALSVDLDLTDRVQCPMGRTRRWAQSYAGKWGGLVRVQIVALSENPWPGDLVRRVTVAEADRLAAILGAVAL